MFRKKTKRKAIFNWANIFSKQSWDHTHTLFEQNKFVINQVIN